MYRAMESERADALFHDRWARQLAGPEGDAILRSIPKGKEAAWPMIVRTQVMDELILQSVRSNGEAVDTVLNLACGLDTRAYRLSLPPALRWYDVDFPEVLNHKQSVLAGERPACALEYVAADLTDDRARSDLFRRVAATATRVLVIAEGLIAYLKDEEVGALARALSAEPKFRLWLLDLASPELLKRLNKSWGKALHRAPLIFGPADGTRFFETFGWSEAEYRGIFQESLRLNRKMRFAFLFQWLGRLSSKEKREKFRRMSGVALLKRK